MTYKQYFTFKRNLTEWRHSTFISVDRKTEHSPRPLQTRTSPRSRPRPLAGTWVPVCCSSWNIPRKTRRQSRTTPGIWSQRHSPGSQPRYRPSWSHPESLQNFGSQYWIHRRSNNQSVRSRKRGSVLRFRCLKVGHRFTTSTHMFLYTY